jgi:hypothetical protein
MLRSRITAWLVGLVICLVLAPSPGTAQTNFGALSGAVADSTGASVPAAQVTITNLNTSERRSMVLKNGG